MRRLTPVTVGSDHAGFPLKQFVIRKLKTMGYPVEDVGTDGTDSVDYPDFAEKVALGVLKRPGNRGVLICGTGIGASIAANKIPGIRAALVENVTTARLSRQHNDANLLVLSGWENHNHALRNILKVWLTTRALGGRHRRRVRKIKALERKYAGRARRSAGR